MDLKSLVTEFQSCRHADKLKSENTEEIYSVWAAQQTSSQSTICNGRSQKGHPISNEIAAIRKEIGDALSSPKNATPTASTHSDKDLTSRVSVIESENKHMKSEIKDLKDMINKLQSTISKLTLAGGDTKKDTAPVSKSKEAEDEIDLFGSDDEEDEEALKVKEQRLKAYEEKKSKKPGVIAKSSVILDVKPWDDETDMALAEKAVRSIEIDGLLWGASKLMPVGYGIKKLQIMCVVEDDKVSIEELQERIEGFEDYVQSVDIAAFNKI